MTLTAWSVEYHKPRGFKFTGLKWREEVHDLVYPTSYSQFQLVSAHVCGDDPNVVWQTQVSEDSNWPLFGHHVFSGVVDGSWRPGGSMHASGSLGGVAKVDLVVPGPPLLAKLTFVPPVDPVVDYKSFLQVTQVPVEDDLSCPDNP